MRGSVADTGYVIKSSQKAISLIDTIPDIAYGRNIETEAAMAKLYEIERRISQISGISAHEIDGGIRVCVTGDQPEMVPIVRAKLEAAGVPFSQSKHRKFKGAFFDVPLRNVGTAFNANWEIAA